jgi:hypothetical protein
MKALYRCKVAYTGESQMSLHRHLDILAANLFAGPLRWVPSYSTSSAAKRVPLWKREPVRSLAEEGGPGSDPPRGLLEPHQGPGAGPG